MPIDYRQLRTVTAREIIRALSQDGFFLRNQRGSHQRYQNPDGRRVTVSFHRPSDTFAPKTLKIIVESQARWTEDPLTDMHESCIIMHMRTTLNLDDELIEEARKFTGIQEKTALVHKGLKALVAQEAARRLAALGGSQPDFRAAPRRRPKPPG